MGRGDPTGWFERLHGAGESGEVTMAWDRDDPAVGRLVGFLLPGQESELATTISRAFDLADAAV